MFIQKNVIYDIHIALFGTRARDTHYGCFLKQEIDCL